MEQTANIIDKLARTESGRLVSVLTRIFGIHNLGMAEDVVQDVMIKALKNWQTNGVPDNPSAWLYQAARNKAIDNIRRYKRQRTFATDITLLLESEYTAATTVADCFKEEEIRDDLLRMMFACCDPSINRESQIALIMKTLCGFSVQQISRAFITSKDTVEKRLYRARQAFRDNDISLSIPNGVALEDRLNNVLETIYLLFNEAHSASYHDSLTRRDLADETIRLCTVLATYTTTSLPCTNALLALLYFHSARLPARVDKHGDLLLMKDQDRDLWDKEMIQNGVYYLTRAATGNNISRYHIEAAIAFEHCKAKKYADTDWETILDLYNMLVQIVPTPVVLLNRSIAIKELQGSQAALQCIREIPGIDYLNQYYLLHAILGELYSEMQNKETALTHFGKALTLCVSEPERRLIAQKIASINKAAI